MAKGKKTGGKNFEVGNPYGRPALPADVKKARRLTKAVFDEHLDQLLKMPIKDIEAYVKNPGVSSLFVIVGQIIIAASKGADHTRLTMLLDRLIGKVTDKIQHSLPKPAIIEKLDGSKMALIARQEDEE